MRREGFTLLEIMIALAIIAALAAISIPAIFNAVMKIEEESVVESAMLGLRQFFVDARAKSVMNEERFEFEEVDNTLKFTGVFSSETIHYSLPSGLRTDLEMEATPVGTFSYVLGLFIKETTDKYVIEDNLEDGFAVTVQLEDGAEFENGATMVRLSIIEGLPKWDD